MHDQVVLSSAAPASPCEFDLTRLLDLWPSLSAEARAFLLLLAEAAQHRKLE